MAIVDILLPSLGEGITDATILNWHKKPGDTIQEDDTLVDIATDKVDSEVPSTASGIVKEILFEPNQVAAVGSAIARVETGIEERKEKPAVEETNKEETLAVPYQPEQVFKPSENQVSPEAPNNGFFSPLVLNIARTENIPLSELEKIVGTGKDNRVSKEDILQYLSSKNNTTATAEHKITKVTITHTETQTLSIPSIPNNRIKNNDSVGEVIEMDRMRRLIAHHMKESQNISATVTSFEEADVTTIVQWRNKVKNAFEARENTKITFTPIFIDCVIKVLKRYPMLNSSVDGNNIILKKELNIGMATALPSGNLIVPVIKNAAYLNLAGLAHEVNSLAKKARENKLAPTDTQSGTFTITNVGSFGSITGTPIINQPEVAILALGSIKKKPVVIETQDGDTIGIRQIMMLSLSYDHRIIDGAMGSKFLHEIVLEMENWNPKEEF